jgi:hypothetical protein
LTLPTPFKIGSRIKALKNGVKKELLGKIWGKKEKSYQNPIKMLKSSHFPAKKAIFSNFCHILLYTIQKREIGFRIKELKKWGKKGARIVKN